MENENIKNLIGKLSSIINDIKIGRAAAAVSAIEQIINDTVPPMALKEIKAETLSSGAKVAGCIYQAIEAAAVLPMEAEATPIILDKGKKIMIAGAGGQSRFGMSYYLYGDAWVLAPDASFLHVANKRLPVAPDGHPKII